MAGIGRKKKRTNKGAKKAQRRDRMITPESISVYGLTAT
jgi:hypothetical protein